MPINAELFDLTGRTAIVTGASSGLGVTFATALAEAGANVVLLARRLDRLGALASEIERDGGTALAVACDVGDPRQVRDAVAAVMDRFGRIDVLVNNAGTAGDAGPMPEQLPDELFEQTVRVNLVGLWYCTREVGRVMLASGQGGSIVNISSIAGLSGYQNFPPAYQATKGAVINLTRNLAVSWADRGVRVNCIAPGWFPSETASPFLDIPVWLERVHAQTPMKRVGDPRELIGPLLLLASDAGSYMTGQTIAVDGGTVAFTGPCYPQELFDLHAMIVPGLGERIMPTATVGVAG